MCIRDSRATQQRPKGRVRHVAFHEGAQRMCAPGKRLTREAEHRTRHHHGQQRPQADGGQCARRIVRVVHAPEPVSYTPLDVYKRQPVS